MAAALKIGQGLKGSLDTYCVKKKLYDSVWAATGSMNCKDFIVKTAPPQRFNTERDILRRFQGHPSFRQLVEEIVHPPFLILEHLDNNLLDASNSSKLTRQEIKFVARKVLEALQALHETGHVHTDVKPNNILVQLGGGPMRFTEVKLADFGDVYHIPPNVDPKEDGHIIGAPIFRSPEAMLNLRWGTPTDIWSFGATLINDEAYAWHVLIQQARFFGPFPLSYEEIADEERIDAITTVLNYINGNGLRKPFSMAVDEELTVEDRDFIVKIMKLDPRDRPTAKQLLADEWFQS